MDISSHENWPEESAIVDQGLEESNSAAAPLHEVRQISCIARSPTGHVIGGALGRHWGTCCELQELWVRPDFRRAGLGTRLARAFEQLAVQKGCTSVYLETFSFQAPHLYNALGYEIQYQRNGFPHGIVKFHMLKRLSTPPASIGLDAVTSDGGPQGV